MHMTRKDSNDLFKKFSFSFACTFSRILFRSNTSLSLVFAKQFCWWCGRIGILFSTLTISEKESLTMLSVSIWISKSGTSCSDTSTDCSTLTSLLSYCNICSIVRILGLLDQDCWDCWNIKFKMSLMAYLMVFSVKTFGTILTLKIWSGMGYYVSFKFRFA